MRRSCSCFLLSTISQLVGLQTYRCLDQFHTNVGKRHQWTGGVPHSHVSRICKQRTISVNGPGDVGLGHSIIGRGFASQGLEGSGGGISDLRIVVMRRSYQRLHHLSGFVTYRMHSSEGEGSLCAHIRVLPGL